MADELLLASQRVAPQKLLSSGFSFEHVDARTSLDWAINSAS
jgi:NAD dependent epimerase/dehydratase family enzyme